MTPVRTQPKKTRTRAAIMAAHAPQRLAHSCLSVENSYTLLPMSTEPPKNQTYGLKDTSFKAVGGFEGINSLVESFYQQMDQLPEAKIIRSMHAEDLSLIIDKLTHFLC